MSTNLLLQRLSKSQQGLVKQLVLSCLEHRDNPIIPLSLLADAADLNEAFCLSLAESGEIQFISATRHGVSGGIEPFSAQSLEFPSQGVVAPSGLELVEAQICVQFLPGAAAAAHPNVVQLEKSSHLLGHVFYNGSVPIGMFGFLNPGVRFLSEATCEILEEVAPVFQYVVQSIKRSTPRLKALQELVGQEAGYVYESVLDSLSEGVSCCDRDGRVVYSNPAMERLVGLSWKEMSQRRMYDFLYRTAGESQSKAKEAQHARYVARLEGKSEQYEIKTTRPDGTVQCLEVHASPLRSSSGEIVGSVGIIADQTEKQSLQDQLLWSQKLDAVGRLARNVAHDFNNLLTVILGHSSRLKSLIPETDPHYRRVRAIHEASESASTLTQQLLAVSKRQVVQSTPQDVNQLIRDTLLILRDFVTEGVQIETDLQKDLSLVLIDRGQLQQVVINLSINARDAMPEGGELSISTRMLRIPDSQGQEKCFVAISIRDTGTGMTEEVKSHLFEPFFTTKKDGTGLGLSITHSIVEMHGGRICVNSTLGEGTTFSILLPEYVIPLERPSDDVGSRLPLEAGGSGEQILVVEDEPGVLELVSELLVDAGFSVVQATNGLEALAILERSPDAIQLILSDVAMPKLNGFQLAEKVQDTYPHLPIVLMSGCTNDSALPEHVLARGIPFIAKPFAPDALLIKIRSQLAAGLRAAF